MFRPSNSARTLFLSVLFFFLSSAIVLSGQSIQQAQIATKVAATPEENVAFQYAAENTSIPLDIEFKNYSENKRYAFKEFTNYVHGIGASAYVYAIEASGIFEMLLEGDPVSMKEIREKILQDQTIQKKLKEHFFQEDEEFSFNEGWVHIAMSELARLRWIVREGESASEEISFQLTREGRVAAEMAHAYQYAFSFFKTGTELNSYLVGEKAKGATFKNMLDLRGDDPDQLWGLEKKEDTFEESIRQQVIGHLDGVLFGAVMEELQENHFFENFDEEGVITEEDFTFKHYTYHEEDKGEREQGTAYEEIMRYSQLENKKPFDLAIDILSEFGILEWSKEKGAPQLTAKGKLYSRKTKDSFGNIKLLGWANSFGVPVSYFPTMEKVFDLMFGNKDIIAEKDRYGNESHVNRRKNVKGSGFSHMGYFKKTDAIIEYIFTSGNVPDELIPRYIMDTGSGDGQFSKRVYEAILTAKALKYFKAKDIDVSGWQPEDILQVGREIMDKEDLKVVMIGSDFNPVALAETAKTLAEANIPFEVVEGDINKPEEIEAKLKAKGYKMEDFLHTRSMLSHNRPFEWPADRKAFEERARQNFYKEGEKAFGAYVDSEGNAIPEYILKQNLLDFFERWKPYIAKYGLIEIELHTVHEKYFEDTNVLSSLDAGYFGTHGRQYIIPYEVYLDVLNRSGLSIVPDHETTFPPRHKHLTTVSINWIQSTAVINEIAERRLQGHLKAA